MVLVDELVLAADVAGLVDHLEEPSWAVRRAVIAGLASLGDVAAPTLQDFLATRRTTERAIAAAVDALSAAIGEGATTAGLALLADPRPEVAADGASILGRRRASGAPPALAAALGHSDDNVAMAAIEALGAIGGAAAVDALVGVVEMRNFFRTFPAMHVLARTNDPRAIPALAALLDDELYRAEAIRTLGRTGLVQAIGPLARHRESDPRGIALACADLIARAAWRGAEDSAMAALRDAMPDAARFVGVLADADREETAAIAGMLGVIGDSTTLPVLAQMLADPQLASVATTAVQRIVRGNHSALVAALMAPDSLLRAAALPAASSMQASPAVRSLLTDDDPEVRARACDALARIGDIDAVPALFESLADTHARAAQAAIAAIHSLGSDRTAALTLEALGHESSAVRRHALRIVAYAGLHEALDTVEALVDDPDPRVAELAIVALGAIADPRVDEILTARIRDTRPEMRAAVARAAIARTDAVARSLLVTAVADEHAWVRYHGCRGLGQVQVGDAAELLVARLDDVSPPVRLAALDALAQLSTDDAFQALAGAARSPDADTRRAALTGLTRSRHRGVLPLLLDAMTSADTATVLIAASGLATRAEAAAVAVLARAATHPVPEVATAAVSLLGDRQDAAAAEAIVDLALETALDHPAQAALSRPSTARIAAITKRLREATNGDAHVLAAALGRMRDPAARSELFHALTFDNPAARSAAATVLVELDPRGAREAVGRLAAEDPDVGVRQVSAAALAG